jgi:hypothetical protein
MPPGQGSRITSQALQRVLIPFSAIGFSFQLCWAASIFVALQAWKTADLVLVHRAAYPEQ